MVRGVDDFRTRIAKALYGRLLHAVPLFDDQPEGVQTPWLEDADAVIEALTSPSPCTDLWHCSTGEPYRCPSCGYWMGEGYVE